MGFDRNKGGILVGPIIPVSMTARTPPTLVRVRTVAEGQWEPVPALADREMDADHRETVSSTAPTGKRGRPKKEERGQKKRRGGMLEYIRKGNRADGKHRSDHKRLSSSGARPPPPAKIAKIKMAVS